MSRLRRFVTLISLLVLVALGTQAQRGGSSGSATVPQRNSLTRVTVQVKYENLSSLPYPVRVELLTSGGIPVGTEYTDSSGQASFGPIGFGSYTVRISGEGIKDGATVVDLDNGASMSHVMVYAHPKEVAGQQAEATRAKSPGGTVDATELSAPKNVRKEFERGLQELRAGHNDKAEEHFRRTVEEYPRYSSAWNNLGAVYLKTDRRPQAKDAFTRALKENRNNADAARNLSRMLIQENQFREAETLLKNSLATEPNSPESLTLLAYTELQNREFDDAIVTARKVHTGSSHIGSMSHLVAGLALEATHQDAEATAEFKTFLKESPQSPQAQIARDGLTRVQASQASKD